MSAITPAPLGANPRSRPGASAWSVAAALLLVACGGDGGGDAPAADTSARDTGVARDTATPPPTWTVTTVIGGDQGRQPRAAVLADGTPAVAFLSDGGAEGDLCDPAEPASGPRVVWTLSYAVAPEGAAPVVEEVAAIPLLGAPRGLALAVDPAGDPVIAALTGEPSDAPPYCGANDLGLYRREAGGAWVAEAVVSDSGRAVTGEAASDYGTVVGLWPALAFDPTGAAAVLYQDVHGGGLQADDFKRADLELAWGEGAGWRHLPVDWGKGAGDYNALAFDGAGRPLALTYNPREDLTASERGLWLLRSPDGGASWERVRLHDGGTPERPSLAVDPTTGRPWVAWYHGTHGLPYVAALVDEEGFDDRGAGWLVEEVGDHVYDDGVHPSLAVSPGGVVAAAWYRCARASAGLGDCTPADDALVFAWREDGEWIREVVDEGEAGLCGLTPTLVFSGEAAVIFYPCQVLGDDGFETELRVARRRAL